MSDLYRIDYIRLPTTKGVPESITPPWFVKVERCEHGNIYRHIEGVSVPTLKMFGEDNSPEFLWCEGAGLEGNDE